MQSVCLTFTRHLRHGKNPCPYKHTTTLHIQQTRHPSSLHIQHDRHSSSLLIQDTRHFSSLHNYQSQHHLSNHARHSSTQPRIAIIGSGPAGFYTARKLQRDISPIIDMYERLSVPFGLVRFGVAPDHPEVKNCQTEFESVASSPSFTFIGNVTLGQTLPLSLLSKHYDILVFAYGASQDKQLHIPGETNRQVYSARAFVGWYNGLPEYRDLAPDLSGEKAIVVGQGNVALDVARILLSDVDTLEKTDLAGHAVEVLRKSKIKDVRVVGRRGPVQAAFTIKEVRELMNLPVNFRGVDEKFMQDLKGLERPRRRIMELLKKGRKWDDKVEKVWSLDFLLSPEEIVEGNGIDEVVFRKMELEGLMDEKSRVRSTDEMVRMKADVVFRSIGYRAEAVPGMEEIGASFDEKTGTVRQDGYGRVKVASGSGKASLYCAGWVKRGPTGVIASTMTDAFETAEAIVADWKNVGKSGQKLGWEGVRNDARDAGYQLDEVVDWNGWHRIDSVEKQIGQSKGKPREKISRVREMIDVANSNTS